MLAQHYLHIYPVGCLQCHCRGPLPLPSRHSMWEDVGACGWMPALWACGVHGRVRLVVSIKAACVGHRHKSMRAAHPG